jgi:hypothetical protein
MCKNLTYCTSFAHVLGFKYSHSAELYWHCFCSIYTIVKDYTLNINILYPTNLREFIR